MPGLPSVLVDNQPQNAADSYRGLVPSLAAAEIRELGCVYMIVSTVFTDTGQHCPEHLNKLVWLREGIVCRSS